MQKYRMSKRYVTIFYFVALVFTFIFANATPVLSKGGVKSKFYLAGEYYSQGDYKKAIEIYERILNEGFESGNLYYNLGNCYFKRGQLGMAIFYYQKASRLMPRDSDLRSNYEYAKSFIKGGIIKPKKEWYNIFFDKISSFFTIDELSFILASLFTLILIVILTTMYIPSARKYKWVTLLVLSIVFIIFFSALIARLEALGKEAIIMVEKTDARFEPFESATVYYTLYEGSKVWVISSRGDWCKIERPDGKKGWVRLSDLKIF